MLCEWKKAEILELNIQEDHVHLVISIPPKVSISEMLGFLKGKTAIKIFKSYPELKKKPYWGNHFWARGYFVNVLEGCRIFKVEYLIYASSSSVYGANKKIPFAESDSVDHPVSLYAATKKSNELMAHTYSNLYKIPTTGLRFFTVYGPFGRPDMAYFLFTKSIFESKPIYLFNNGDMERDFTYIDDVVNGISALLLKPPLYNPEWNFDNPDPSSSFVPYSIFNIGNNRPVKLLLFINILESIIGKKAIKKFLPMQAGDVEVTFANIDKLSKKINYSPNTTIKQGLKSFVDGYKKYHLL